MRASLSCCHYFFQSGYSAELWNPNGIWLDPNRCPQLVTWCLFGPASELLLFFLPIPSVSTSQTTLPCFSISTSWGLHWERNRTTGLLCRRPDHCILFNYSEVWVDIETLCSKRRFFLFRLYQCSTFSFLWANHSFYVILFFFTFIPIVVSFLVSSQVFAYRSHNELLAFGNLLRSGLIQGWVAVNRRDQSAVLNVRMDMHISLWSFACK